MVQTSKKIEIVLSEGTVLINGVPFKVKDLEYDEILTRLSKKLGVLRIVSEDAYEVMEKEILYDLLTLLYKLEERKPKSSRKREEVIEQIAKCQGVCDEHTYDALALELKGVRR